MKSTARVVVVGGGIVGVGILYGICKRGWTDVVLCERTELTAGSTWHAAGLVQHYLHARLPSRIVQKSIEIYESLEAETGQAVGWHKCGSLRLASSSDRVDEFLRYMDRSESLGFESELVTPDRAWELWPLLNPLDRVKIGVYNPNDGHIAPADVTMALAAGSRRLGAEIYRNTEVTGFERTAGGEWKVVTTNGEILCEHVITATGLYARELAAQQGFTIPAIPIVHQYMVSEPISELGERHALGLPELPVLKDEVCNGYLREERGGLLFGPYERGEDLELFAEDGVPSWFGADLLPPLLGPVEKHIQHVLELVPSVGSVGIQANVRGPINFTPDGGALIGPAPGLENFWLAEGIAAGPTWAGGIGYYLSEWIIEGEPSIDMWDFDVRRYGDYATKNYASLRNREVFGFNFGIHFPDFQWSTARGIHRFPVHDRLTRAGACWGSDYGWEVPTWFAPNGVEAKDVYSHRRANFFPYVGEECRAVREAVGLMNVSGLAKYELSGPGAEPFLDHFLANRLPAKVGRIRLCHHLTEKGGIAAEFTVARLGDERFYLAGSPRRRRHDLELIRSAMPKDGAVTLKDVTMTRGVFVIAGPNSRAVLEKLVELDLSNETFPWLTAQVAEVAFAKDVIVARANYVGELGWELHHPMECQLSLYESLLEAGKGLELRHVGELAIESLRLDKSYRAMGRDLSPENTPLEAGLERLVCLEKGAFAGREALVRPNRAGPDVRFAVLDVDPRDSDARREEGIYDGANLVGSVTSGGYSHTLERLLVHAYLPVELAKAGTKLDVAVLGERRPARVVPPSPFDPENRRIRGNYG